MYCAMSSFGLEGIEPYAVSVEVDCRKALPGFDIVGLPDAAVRESRDRVRSAMQNLGYTPPNAKILVNLAPADTKKQGAVYDLPILLALLCACGYEQFDPAGTAVVGEIGLGGEVRPVAGVLPMVLEARRLGFERVIIPAANAAEALAAREVEVYCAAGAAEAIAFLKGTGTLPRPEHLPAEAPPPAPQLDLSEVKGQAEAKRALEVAAAGGHNLLLIGPPGTGKSMLASRLPSILPPMSREEAVEVTKIHSVAGLLPPGASLLHERPFRAPHHTLSAGALTGGGSNPRPGELSLAHAGVLFLDELPEFAKNAREVLRQPLEEGRVTISRVRQSVSYPCRVMLVAAMNPCPCGHYGSPAGDCRCGEAAIARYLGKVSGPLLDRIDLHVEVLPVEYEQLASGRPEESSAAVRERVSAARARQTRRLAGSGVHCNADLPSSMIREACAMEPGAESLLRAAFDRMGLSARGYNRILKVSRTIADLDGAERIGPAHISQAVQFRGLDRKYWGAI